MGNHRMAWKPQPAKWNWRKFLTPDEASDIDRSDAEAAKIERARIEYATRWQRRRQLIVNRAIQRAKYAAADR